MRGVTKYIDAGMSASDAIRQALTDVGSSVSQMAREFRELDRSELSSVINFRLVPRERELKALAAVLGGTEQRWYDFWFAQVRAANRRGAADARIDTPTRKRSPRAAR